MKITKNRMWNLIMQEADRIAERSLDVNEMKYKLSALPAKVIQAMDKFEKE